MTKAKTGWLLLGILCLATFAVAQDTAWEKYMKAGTEAYQKGRYSDAEEQFKAALKEAEKFREQGLRVGGSLNSLALLYHAQGKYAEAEPLFRRALPILEKALGPQHPLVAGSLDDLALAHKEQGKYGEAEPLWLSLKANIEAIPAMNQAEFAKALPGISRAVERY